jgi:hypothetical protein
LGFVRVDDKYCGEQSWTQTTGWTANWQVPEGVWEREKITGRINPTGGVVTAGENVEGMVQELTFRDMRPGGSFGLQLIRDQLRLYASSKNREVDAGTIYDVDQVARGTEQTFSYLLAHAWNTIRRNATVKCIFYPVATEHAGATGLTITIQFYVSGWQYVPTPGDERLSESQLGEQVGYPVDETADIYTDATSGTKHGPTVIRADYGLVAAFVKLGATAKRLARFVITEGGIPLYEISTKELADRFMNSWASAKRQAPSDDQYLVEGIQVPQSTRNQREIQITADVATTVTIVVLMGVRS